MSTPVPLRILRLSNETRVVISFRGPGKTGYLKYRYARKYNRAIKKKIRATVDQ